MTYEPKPPTVTVPLQAVARVREGGILAMPRELREPFKLVLNRVPQSSSAAISSSDQT